MIASDLRRALDDCGDGIEVKADGRALIAAQIEGTDPRYLNLISQPSDVRLPQNEQEAPAPVPATEAAPATTEPEGPSNPPATTEPEGPSDPPALPESDSLI
jgi:hypothetical protein